MRFGTSQAGWAGAEVEELTATAALSAWPQTNVVLRLVPGMRVLHLDALLGAPASVALHTGGGWRIDHGMVTEATLTEHLPRGESAARQRYRVTIEPGLPALRERRTRSFGKRSVMDVVNTILGPPLVAAPVAPGKSWFVTYEAPTWRHRWVLVDDAAATREHVVEQRDETDADLIQRLLVEHGLHFFFETTAQGALMTLTDTPDMVETVAHVRRYRVAANTGESVHELAETRRLDAEPHRACVVSGRSNLRRLRPGHRVLLERSATAETNSMQRELLLLSTTMRVAHAADGEDMTCETDFVAIPPPTPPVTQDRPAESSAGSLRGATVSLTDTHMARQTAAANPFAQAGGPQLTIQQYAKLCARLAEQPAARGPILASVGIESDAAHRALVEAWNHSLASDGRSRKLFDGLVDHFRRQLAERARGEAGPL